MKFYITCGVFFALLSCLGILGYVKYEELSYKINASNFVGNQNDSTLQKEIQDLQKRKPINKFYLVLSDSSTPETTAPSEKPNKYSEPTTAFWESETTTGR